MPSRCEGSLGILQLLLDKGSRLVGLRLLQAFGFLLLALLPRVSLCRLPEVGGGVGLPSSGGRLCRPQDRGDGESLKGKRGPGEDRREYVSKDSDKIR